MKILVINSPLFRNTNNRYDEDSLPPIGLGLIATALEKSGHNVEFIDTVALKMPLQELIHFVNGLKPDFICSNVFTTNLELVKELIEAVNYKTHFIIGSLATQSLYAELFNLYTNNKIDIIHGDGELITPAIVNDLIAQKPLYEGHNRRFFRVDNSSQYYVSDISEEFLNRSYFVNEPINHPLGFTEANIVTSRGCIYNCAFCAAAASLSKEFGTREKSVASVKSEISKLIELYPDIQSIRVLDDLFLKNSNSVSRAIEIFKDFDLQWRSMAHVQTFKDVSDETIRLLEKSRCKELFIGIESGSPDILKQIHKTSNVELIKKNVTKLLMNNINVKGYFIYGFPNETVDDFEKTYMLAEYFKNVSKVYGSKFRTSVFQFRPYHGTEIYHDLKSKLGNDTFTRVATIEPNNQLSELVGRMQFNFHSGNYSNESIELVQKYIYKTVGLNTLYELFPKNHSNFN